jgi:hypothetical protein
MGPDEVLGGREVLGAAAIDGGRLRASHKRLGLGVFGSVA